MDIVDSINLAVAIASIILGIGAGALSVYFFVETKKTEGSTSQLLGEIRQQTQSLEKLSGKLLTQMTAAVMGPRASDEVSMAIIEKVFPAAPSTPLIAADQDADSAEIRSTLDYKILAFYFCGIANVASQNQLPDMNDGVDDDVIRNLIDRSYSDYQVLKSELSNQASDIEGNYFRQSYEFAIRLDELVQDSVRVWRAREVAQRAAE